MNLEYLEFLKEQFETNQLNRLPEQYGGGGYSPILLLAWLEVTIIFIKSLKKLLIKSI